MSIKNRTFAFVVEDDDAGRRLDTLISASFPELSRNTAGRLIRQGIIRVNARVKKPAVRVVPGQVISGRIPEKEAFILRPEPIPIDVLFEDDACLVINKPPGLVVHPSPGHDHGTLANGLAYYYPEIEGVGGVYTRPGIVHRLDKDTSGIMLVAKTESAHADLSLQFKARTIHKTYLGFVFGSPSEENGRITLPIGRHPNNRKKMSSTSAIHTRHAETLWRIKKRFSGISLLEFIIKTGRTHQIRVHCAAIRHPIIGDSTYGIKRPQKTFSDRPETVKALKTVRRQMLHARRLEFMHPVNEKIMRLEAPLPEDMIRFQDAIEKAS